MTIRFHRRLNPFKWFHLNFSKRGIGWSVGPRGFHVGKTADGRRYVSAGLPGTGVYVREDERKRIK